MNSVSNIQSILQTNFLLNMKDSNFGIIFSTIICIFIGWISKKLNEIEWSRKLKKLNCFRKKTKSSFTVIGTIYEMNERAYDNTFEIPDEFMATMFILDKMKIDIFKGKRLGVVDTVYIDSDENGNVKDNKFSYFINHEKEIYIKNDVYIKQTEDEMKAEDKKTTKIQIELEFFSNKLNFSQLKKEVDSWVKEYHEYVKTNNDGQLYYFSYVGKKNDSDKPSFEKHKFSTSKTFDNIFFEDKQKLLKRLDTFLNDKEKYTRLGLPNTLGMMFYGYPGCGKTSTIKALANKTDRHVVEISLSRIQTCKELKKIFFQEIIHGKYVPPHKKIIVLEDIDCMSDVVQDRSQTSDFKTFKEITKLKKLMASDTDKKEKEKQLMKVLDDAELKDDDVNTNKDKLTLSFILNLIDGILEQPGRMLIITTNYPEKLDSALVRPGRIDIKIHYKKCNNKISNQILSYVFNEDIDDKKLPNYVWSPAEIFEKCLNIGNSEDTIKELKVIPVEYDSELDETIDN